MKDLELAVSIVVPCHNSSATVARTLDALVAQDFALPYRIVAVDDGSTDNTLAILKSYERHYPAIVIVVAQPHGNLPRARNAGLPLALAAKYVGFCDSDDLPHADFISALYALAERTHADCAVMNYRNVANGVAKTNRSFFAIPRVMRGIDAAYQVLKDGKCKAYVWNKLFRADLLTRNGIDFLPENFTYEDTVFTFQCFLMSERVAFSPYAIYDYMIRDDSLSHEPKPNAFLMHINAYAACRAYLGFYFGRKAGRRMFYRARFTLRAKVLADIMTARIAYAMPLRRVNYISKRFLAEVTGLKLPIVNRPWERYIGDLPLFIQVLPDERSEAALDGGMLWKNA